MKDRSGIPSDEGHPRDIRIDTRVARPARIHNYLSGGTGHFTADREAVGELAEVLPGGVEAARATLRVLGDFVERAVTYLVAEAGIRQVVHIGTPVPAGSEVHEIAQRIAPEARIVYVGDDPVVLAHAHELRRSRPEGATAYVHGHLRAPEEIWERAAATLDPAQPVAVLLVTTLSFVADELDPPGLVARLLRAAVPGSHLVIAHSTEEIPAPGMVEAARRMSEAMNAPYVLRDRAHILRFFDGLELVDPGLVKVDHWHPPRGSPAPAPDVLANLYAGVARKP